MGMLQERIPDCVLIPDCELMSRWECLPRERGDLKNLDQSRGAAVPEPETT